MRALVNYKVSEVELLLICRSTCEDFDVCTCESRRRSLCWDRQYLKVRPEGLDYRTWSCSFEQKEQWSYGAKARGKIFELLSFLFLLFSFWELRVAQRKMQAYLMPFPVPSAAKWTDTHLIWSPPSPLLMRSLSVKVIAVTAHCFSLSCRLRPSRVNW